MLAGIIVAGALCSPAYSDYAIANMSDLIDDMGGYWRLYDHDTIGSVNDTHFRYSSESFVVKLNSPASSVKFNTGGSDWRGVEVFGSQDGNAYESLKLVCCYGSGDYLVDTYKYGNPFYLKFLLSSGACCGTASYVTLSKTITPASTKCTDSDGEKTISWPAR